MNATETVDTTTNISSSRGEGGGGVEGELIYGKVITILYTGNFDQYITLLLN